MPADALILLLAFAASMAGGFAALFVWRKYILQPEQPKHPEPLPAETQAAVKTDLMTVQNWIAWNPWYLQDEALRLEAQSVHLMRQRTHPGEPLEDNLEQVAVEMKRRYPEISPTLN
jgi:hypothetical protein